MLTTLKYKVSPDAIQNALAHIPTDSLRVTISQPTGNFFYDPWVVKEEFVGTVWEQLLSVLPAANVGEARVITLAPGSCYQIHADIDDRYHLNIAGDNGYLVDIEHNDLHQTVQDGQWYLMDAGRLHSAANFGRDFRLQLVVRKLLIRNVLSNSVPINLISNNSMTDDHNRFLFDNTISPWLNKANKLGYINDFSYSPVSVKFNIEHAKLDLLKDILPKEFEIV